jgi:hypothetical protein
MFALMGTLLIGTFALVSDLAAFRDGIKHEVFLGPHRFARFCLSHKRLPHPPYARIHNIHFKEQKSSGIVHIQEGKLSIVVVGRAQPLNLPARTAQYEDRTRALAPTA